MQAHSSSSSTPVITPPTFKKSNGKKWITAQNQDDKFKKKKNQNEVKFPKLLVSQYHSLSAYTVPCKIINTINRIQTSPQLDDLKLLLNLKFGEKHNCHLRCSRPSQSKASPVVRGREVSMQSQLLPKSSLLTGTSVDCFGAIMEFLSL